MTPDFYIDNAIELARSGKIILTFGDMVRVRGTGGALEEAGNYRIIYSPSDALRETDDREKEYVFLGVGFETTAPLCAWLIREAKRRRIKNLSVYSAHKIIPPALRLIEKDNRVDGFILPGHVSAVIGAKAYGFLKKPAVISGFEAEDILESILLLLKMITKGKKGIINQYRRAVSNAGNLPAEELMNDVFLESDAVWRGLGRIRKSGLRIKREYYFFDAEKRFGLKERREEKRRGCRCGEVIRGIIEPPECSMFRKVCTPRNPLGPCMVSTEGSCSAYYKYANG